MSTRATYRFTDADKTFYIHHDGHLRGAAHYFRRMMIHPDFGSRPDHEVFAEANERAEETESHEVHGDTEYRYDIIKGRNQLRIKVYSRDAFDANISSYPLSNFVSMYNEWPDDMMGAVKPTPREETEEVIIENVFGEQEKFKYTPGEFF